MSWSGTDLTRTVTACTGIVILVQVLATMLVLGRLCRLRREHIRSVVEFSKLINAITNTTVLQCEALSALLARHDTSSPVTAAPGSPLR